MASAGVSDVPLYTPPAAAAAGAGSAGPQPTTWANVPGAPASMAVAPPSAFTASSPEEQARWNAVSTPQGYAAALRELANASAPTTAPVTPVSRRALPPPAVTTAGPGPIITGPGTVMPPMGGALGWAGTPGLPGTPSGPAVAGPGPGSAPIITGPGSVMPPMGGALGWAGTPGLPGTQSGVGRALSDEEINRIQPGDDILSVVGRSDLTDADRAALDARLNVLGNEISPGLE
jgi:hypothetical protein